MEVHKDQMEDVYTHEAKKEKKEAVDMAIQDLGRWMLKALLAWQHKALWIGHLTGMVEHSTIDMATLGTACMAV